MLQMQTPIQRMKRFMQRMDVGATITLASPSFLSVPLTLIAVPLILSRIGLTDFGKLVLIMLIIHQSHIFLLGSEKNLIRKIVETKKPLTFLGTASLVSFAYGCILAVGLAFLFLALYMNGIESLNWSALLPSLASIPLHFLWSTQRSILQGKEQLATLGLSTFAYMAAMQYVPLLVILVTPELASLSSFLWAILAQRSFLCLWLLYRDRRLRKGQPKHRFDAQSILDVFGLVTYGKWLGINQAVQMFFDGADRYLLGLMTSPAMVALYAMPLQVSQKIAVLPVALAQIIFNRSVNYDEERSAGYLSGVLFMMPIGAGVFFCLCDPFFKLWLGQYFTPMVTNLAILLFVAIVLTSLNFITASMLEGSGHAKAMARLDLIAFLPVIGVMAALTYKFGPLGTASAVIFKEAIFFFSRLLLLRPAKLMIYQILLAFTLLGTGAILTMNDLAFTDLFLAQGVLISSWIALYIGKRWSLVGFDATR